jgi:hypothetical protein
MLVNMKITGIIILTILSIRTFSQDQIITKDNETLLVRIVLEEKKLIKFYLIGNADKNIQEMDKKSIKKIKYEKPSSKINTILITDDSLENKDLFSHITSYLIESGFELGTFDMEHLSVSALTSSNRRISVEVKGHDGYFSIYQTKKEVEDPPSQSKSNVIRLAPAEKKEDAEEKYPGEEQVDAGNTAFKELDRVCRNYLIKNKGTLKYMTE